jgi:predicted transcriptional regulator
VRAKRASKDGHSLRKDTMAMTRHMIEVDETTATLLRDRAEARGMSVSALVAGLVALTEQPSDITPEELAELDRQMAAIESGEEATYPHEEVERWLLTWGSPDYKPFHEWRSAQL